MINGIAHKRIRKRTEKYSMRKLLKSCKNGAKGKRSIILKLKSQIYKESRNPKSILTNLEMNS